MRENSNLFCILSKVILILAPKWPLGYCSIQKNCLFYLNLWTNNCAHCGKIPIFVQKIKFSTIPFLAGKFKCNVGVDFNQNLRSCISVINDFAFCDIVPLKSLIFPYFNFVNWQFFVSQLSSISTSGSAVRIFTIDKWFYTFFPAVPFWVMQLLKYAKLVTWVVKCRSTFFLRHALVKMEFECKDSGKNHHKIDTFDLIFALKKSCNFLLI